MSDAPVTNKQRDIAEAALDEICKLYATVETRQQLTATTEMLLGCTRLFVVGMIRNLKPTVARDVFLTIVGLMDAISEPVPEAEVIEQNDENFPYFHARAQVWQRLKEEEASRKAKEGMH